MEPRKFLLFSIPKGRLVIEYGVDGLTKSLGGLGSVSCWVYFLCLLQQTDLEWNRLFRVPKEAGGRFCCCKFWQCQQTNRVDPFLVERDSLGIKTCPFGPRRY